MTFVMPIAAASGGRIAIGAVIALVGLLMLAFNKRVTTAAVTAQREGIGTLLGDRRQLSDEIQSSPAFSAAARLFVCAVAVFFVAGGVVMTVTAR